MASMSGGTGILLLVEAEMSRPMYELDTGDSNAQEAEKKHNCISTKGVGLEVPLQFKDASTIHDDLKGVLMVSSLLCNAIRSRLLTLQQPDGKLGHDKNHKGGYLQYNEYVSYNVEHLRIRYLLKVAM